MRRIPSMMNTPPGCFGWVWCIIVYSFVYVTFLILFICLTLASVSFGWRWLDVVWTTDFPINVHFGDIRWMTVCLTLLGIVPIEWLLLSQQWYLCLWVMVYVRDSHLIVCSVSDNKLLTVLDVYSVFLCWRKDEQMHKITVSKYFHVSAYFSRWFHQMGDAGCHWALLKTFWVEWDKDIHMIFELIICFLYPGRLATGLRKTKYLTYTREI